MSKPYDQCYTLEDRFLYFIDCQLATVEDLEMLKNPPKSRLERHRAIAAKMIETARGHKLLVDGMSRVQRFEESSQ